MVILVWYQYGWKNDIAQNTPFVWELRLTWYFLCGTVFFRNMKPSECFFLRASSAQKRQLSSNEVSSLQMMTFKCHDAWFFTSKCCTPRSLNLQGQAKLQVAIYLALGKVGTNMRYKWKYKRSTDLSVMTAYLNHLMMDEMEHCRVAFNGLTPEMV